MGLPMLRAAILSLLLLPLACKAGAPDPLAEHRKTCQDLQDAKALRAGLTIDDCARELKARADLADPVRQADELIARISTLVGQGKGKADAAQQSELRDSVSKLKELGKPAVPATLAKMKQSGDADLRIALAKALVGICAGDCAERKFDCIVPALLEGTGEDKPHEVRLEAQKGLTHCTGEQLGDDPAAWKKWWAGAEGKSAARLNP